MNNERIRQLNKSITFVELIIIIQFYQLKIIFIFIYSYYNGKFFQTLIIQTASENMQVGIISTHLIEQKPPNLSNQHNILSLFNSYFIQKNTNQSSNAKNQNNIGSKHKRESTNIKKQIKQKVNDENCSYYANCFKSENKLQQSLPKKQDITKLRFQNRKTTQFIGRKQNTQKSQQAWNQVVNLKKKIKKCQNNRLFIKQSSFLTERVKFSRKTCKLKPQFIDQIQVQQKTQMEMQNTYTFLTFPVYKDTEVFTGKNSQQLRNIVVTQRMDNDVETDEQQVQQFLKKITNDFVEHVEMYNKEKSSMNKQPSFWESQNEQQQ